MSRSNNTENPNPARRFYQWVGDKGGFRYFDKSLGEKGENVYVPLPISFLVLDTLSTIKGFDDATQSGFWSNEVKDIRREVLTVRNKSGVCAKGLYEQVITDRNCTGAKYCQSVYVGTKEPDGTWIICNIQMTGAALGAWIEFRKKNKIFEGGILVDEMLDGKKGATKYKIPVFKKIDVATDTEEIAKGLDQKLQAYLKTYFERNREAIIQEHVEAKVQPVVDEAPPIKDDDLPF